MCGLIQAKKRKKKIIQNRNVEMGERLYAHCSFCLSQYAQNYFMLNNKAGPDMRLMLSYTGGILIVALE